MSSRSDWADRFRAPRWTLPAWGHEAPDHLVLSGDRSGTVEIYTWTPGTEPRQITQRPNGTMIAAITPGGQEVWWFDDTDGDEFGRWRRQVFGGPSGSDVEAAPGMPAAYPSGLAFGPHGRVVVGGSDDAGSTLYADGGADGLRILYTSPEDAGVDAISRDGGLVAMSHSEHGDSRHPALRVLRWDGTTVADLWDGAGKALHVVAFLGDTHDLLVQHERHGRDELLVWSPDTGAVRELDIVLPGELAATPAPDGSWLLVVAAERGRTTLHRYDLESAALEALPTPAGTIDAVRIRPDGTAWYEWSSAAEPTDIRDLDGASVLPSPGDPTPPPSVPVTDVLAGGPGGQVHAFLRLPDDRSGPHAAVFVVHGGPTWNDSDAWAVRSAAWVDHGYAVVTVNYRGSTGYGAAWRDAIEASPGFVELEDVAAVRAQLVADGLIDPARCVLTGGSWGGFLTLLGIGTQPELWACGSAGVPVADYVAAYEDEMEGLKAFDRSLFGGSPETNPAAYEKASPINYVDAVTAPVLILAGENDPRCPIRQIDNYLAAMSAAGKEHALYRFDAGHGSLVATERIAQMQAELDFVTRQVPSA